ncbi:hypothetical protein HGF13_08865 [Rhodobacteraceae bacterium R_SAG5]|nr:hypothetical protein [Tritonibacter mobilis]NKX39663.1 hypothetical protein [Rhodobacteraceae bacterium R_SAG5]NKX75925.1 hypothetical protein [Rhodobacteraceae bacterium R_SAG3]
MIRRFQKSRAGMVISRLGPNLTFELKGRDLAAWLGLVPRQVTTGGKA